MLFSLVIFFSNLLISINGYDPDWDSLDKRPMPKWFNDAKFGIMVHWGLPAVPGFGTDWFWWRWQGQKQARYVEYMKKHFPNISKYEQLADIFSGSHFDPRQWADLFQASGARYNIFIANFFLFCV